MWIVKHIPSQSIYICANWKYQWFALSCSRWLKTPGSHPWPKIRHDHRANMSLGWVWDGNDKFLFIKSVLLETELSSVSNTVSDPNFETLRIQILHAWWHSHAVLAVRKMINRWFSLLTGTGTAGTACTQCERSGLQAAHTAIMYLK